MNEKNVFIIGSKGVPATYGGFEQFVDKLTEYKTDDAIRYHVSCRANNEDEFEHHGAHCFNVRMNSTKSYTAIIYDLKSFKYCCDYIEKNNIPNPIVYVLACRMGPFFKPYVNKIHKLGGRVFLNPDGHEWKRAKWSFPVRCYWKISEKLMVKNADFVICDSKNIEKYILETYGKHNVKTTFIAYGSDSKCSVLENDGSIYSEWLTTNSLKSNEYYLAVGRFVPENNYEVMIREFMKTKTDKSFVIVSTKNNTLYSELENKLQFSKDKRIKFVGTVYNQELLKKIRENAFAYLHGHSVGGTNPSLIESMGSTRLNLLYDVGFNREVGEDAALYWSADLGSLSELIDNVEELTSDEIADYNSRAKNRVAQNYTWELIAQKYEDVFNGR